MSQRTYPGSGFSGTGARGIGRETSSTPPAAATTGRPAPRSEYYRLAAEALGAPPPRFVPAEPGSPEAGREGSNKRVSNRRMHDDLGLSLIYPDIATGVPAAIGSS